MPVTVRELKDIPRIEPNCSFARVFYSNYHAAVVYEINPHLECRDIGWACIEFKAVSKLCAGYPNDEGIGHHPMFGYGLRPYAAVEVINSPWITAEFGS